MKLTFEIARRYLLGKKSNNAINIITWISILGITIGTAALILILSVFNGFESLLSSLFDSFNPDMKIVLDEGKSFYIDDETVKQIKAIDGVVAVSKTIEETALFEYKDAQEVGTIKGVDSEYHNATDIYTTVKRGDYILKEGNINYAVIGAGMRTKLGVNYNDVITPISIHMPLRKKVGLISSPFKTLEVYPSGVFSVQSEADLQYIISNYEFVNKLLSYENKTSALELRLQEDYDEDEIRSSIKALMGPGYVIKNSYQQNEAYLKIMNIEKWVSYLIASLTMVMIAFNMVGCLWMIVLDKRKDISILKSMGMTVRQIKEIFIAEGMLIGMVGVLIGTALALFMYFLQKQFGLVSIPDGFMVRSYPIELKLIDFSVVIATVLGISYIASILPARKAARIETQLRSD
tara:strand:+ start:12354 stop:13571 length:1218 start_codon:yes stop_codon:yes gene_type:complete